MSSRNVFPTPPKLHSAYRGAFLIGTALSIEALSGQDPVSVSIACDNFNAFTAENSMKPEILQPVQGEFYWEAADCLMEMAGQCGATPIGHTLVWHQQCPDWFFLGPDGKPLKQEVALGHMRAHIQAVVSRYKGRVKEWDVVNEAISDKPDEELRRSGWFNAAGEEFIAEAFRTAHEADPDAVLIYNDYNIEIGEKHAKTLRLLTRLLSQNVPVHAVGIQAHWHLHSPDLAEVELSIQQFAALGLKVMITELDMGVLPTQYQGADIQVKQELQAGMNPYTEGLPAETARLQAERYEQIFRMFLRNQSVIDRVTFWGVHDGVSWFNNFPVEGRTDYPLTFGRDGQPKAAFHAVTRAITQTVN